MKRSLSAVLVACTVMAWSSAADAAVILNFDDLATNSVVGTYMGVTFSTPTGDGEVRVFTAAQFAHTGLNSIGAHPGGGFDFNATVDVTFSGAVNNLMFWSSGDDRSTGGSALIDVFGSSGLLGTVNLVSDGGPFTDELQDLSAFLNVTRISIRNVTDPAGLVYDTFSFDAAQVPEPAALSILGLGFAAVAARRRGGRKQKIS